MEVANNAEFTMVFKIREDGSLILAEKNIKKAGKAVSDLGSAQGDAAKNGKKHNDVMNGGVSSANNSARSMSKLLETVGGNNSGLVAAYATLATNAFAVSAAFSLLRGAAQSAQVMEGLRVQGARLGVTLTNTASSIQEISRGSLSMADSMQAAAQASAAGFSTKNITDLTEAAQNASIALGRNMPDALDRMIKGTTKLEPELLDELGVMVKLTEANNKYALAHQKTALSLTSTEKRQAFLNAVLEESKTKFGGLSKEVEANPYDKLAATFDNLVKDMTNFVDTSIGVRSVVGFLADNTGALVSVLILFASTISRQLIPSLYSMSAAALQSKAALEAKIATQMRSVKASIAQAAAEKELAKANILNNIQLDKTPPKMQQYITDMQEGVKTTEELVQARKQAARQLGGQKSSNTKAFKRGDRTQEEYAARKEELESYSTVLNRITQEEIQHANTISSAEIKAENLRKQNRGMRLQAAAQVASSSAIEVASTFNVLNAQEILGKSYKNSSKAIALYKGGIDKSTQAWIANVAGSGMASKALGGLTSIVNTGRASLFAASLAARTLGAALLNMIPIIGQLLFIWEMLKEAFSFVKELFFPDPAGTKELQAAVDAHNEILKSTQDTAKVTSSIFGDTGRGSAQITQGLVAVSSKVNEVVDSFTEVEKRSRALGTEAAKQLADPAKAINIVSGQSAKEEAKVAVESISALRTLGYTPLIKEIDKAITYNKAFWESSGQDQAATATKVLNKLKDKYGELGDTSKSIDENYKKISNSYDAFVTSATVKTPFDELVKNWDDQVVAITTLQKQLKDGTISLQDFGKTINQIRNDSTVNFIDPNSIKQLEYIKSLEADRARQQELYDSGKLGNGAKQWALLNNIAAATARIAEEEGNLAQAMAKAQLNAAAELVDKQKAFILGQGELKVIQAKLQANASLLSSGEEGVRYRLKLEKESRDIQIQSLKTQKSLIDAKIENSKAQLKYEQDSLDRAAEALVIEKLKTLETAKRSAIEAGLSQEQMQSGAKKIVQRGAGRAGNGDQVVAQSAYLEALKATESIEQDRAKRVSDRQTAEKALEISTRRDKLSSLSIEKEIEAIQQSGVSAQKTIALISQARLNRISKEREDQQALLDQALIIAEIERKRSVLLSGNAASFSEEVKSLKEAANAERRRILNSYEAQRLKLLGEIQVAEADVRDATAESSGIANETLKSAKEKLAVLDSSTAATIAQKDAEADLTLQTKLYVDTRKEGIEIQQQSLEYLQKEVDLAGELAKTRLSTSQINKEIILKRQGLYKTEEQQQSFEIETATQAYQLAVKEAALKKSLIDLEFALLDGQREVLKQQLIERKAEMLSAGYSEKDTSIQQISTALENIDRSPKSSELAALAKQQVDASIEQLGATLKNMITAGGSAEDPIVKMLSTIKGIQEKAIAREAAKQALNNSPTGNPIAKAVVESGDKQISVAKMGVARSNELLEKIVANTDKNAADSQKGISLPAGRDLLSAAVAKTLQAGAKVSEMAGYGGVTPGAHKGKGHAEGRAFDVNFGPGMSDSTNPILKARADKLAADLTAMGLKVLWQVEGHFNHMHVEVGRNAMKIAKTIEQKTSEAVSAVSSAVDTSEIVVKGAKPPIGMAPIGIPKETYAPVDIGVRTDFSHISDTDWDGIRDKVEQVNAVVDMYSEKLKALGPAGEVAAALAQGSIVFSNSWLKALESMDSSTATTESKISAVANAISASIGVIQSVLSAASNAKIAGIDREIAAEEKRDGKSAASVAKLDAMEKKKDGIARKSFNTNKKLMLAQAVMSTVAGVAGVLSQSAIYGPILTPVLAGMIGAMGMAQVAIISGTQYESSYVPKSATMPSTLSIGKRSDTVDLAKGPSANAGGEAGYLRGSAGSGSDASNYRTVGSAYGGELMRGYGNRGFVVGEKGPEVITPDTPISVTPAGESSDSQPITAHFNIQALDSSDVQRVLVEQKGNIIKMLRQAANASGKTFMENVNVNVYSRPGTGKL